MKSNCCGAGVYVSWENEGTNCWICCKCDKPCDAIEEMKTREDFKTCACGRLIVLAHGEDECAICFMEKYPSLQADGIGPDWLVKEKKAAQKNAEKGIE